MNELASLQSKVEVWGNGGLTDQLQGLNETDRSREP